jgi:site-specific DNA recombinase
VWLRSGIEIHTCDIGKIESELDIVLVIKGWQGSDERKRIIERTSRGRRSKATGGLVVGQGFAPYGYEFERVPVNGTGRPIVVGLVIVEEEGRIVRLIFQWYVLGEEKGTPVATLEICRRLQAMCVPVPSKRHFWGERKGIWSPTILYKILKNETYAGVWRWGKNIGAGGCGGQRPVAEQVAINVPAIVDRKLWEAAQMKLEYNRQVSKRGAHHFFLLRSMIRCRECGRRMVGHYVHKSKMLDPRYYRCTSIGETWRKRTCKQKMVRAGEVEPAVWDYVLGLIKGGDFEKKIRDAQATRLTELEPKRDELETVTHLITNCEAEAAELATAVTRVGEGVVRRKLDMQVKEVDARYNALIKRRDELQAELNAPDLKEEHIAAALQFREHVLVGMENPSPEDKRRVLEMLGVEVKVLARTIWVSLRVESDPKVIPLSLQTF